MVTDSPRPAGRHDASERIGRLAYFRLSGAEWLYALVAIAGVSVAVLSVHPLGLRPPGILAPIATPIASTMAAIGLMTTGRRPRGRHRRRARPEAPERSAWMWAGAGLLVVALADAARTIETLGWWPLGPLGAWPSIGSAAGLALAAIGAALIPRLTANRHGRRRAMADAIAGAAASGILIWELFVGPPTSGDRLVAVATVAAISAAVGALLFTGLRGPRHRSDLPFLAFAAGLVGLSAALAIRLPTAPVISALEIARPLELASAAAILVAVIAVRQSRVERSGTERLHAVAAAVPYLPVAVLLGVAAHRLVGARSGVALLVGGLVAAVLAFAASRLATTHEAREVIEEERDRMVASVSHELQTPLTALTGFSDVLASDWESLDDVQRAEMVEIIRDQSRRLAELVSDMVSLVGDRMHSVELDVRQVDGKSLIAGAVREVFDLGMGAIPVTLRIEPYLEVMGDRRRLEQVLVMLLENARRYKRARVLIDAHRQGAWRVIEIHDDGQGLSEEDEAIVWDRFRRGANDLNARVPGAGLGLTKARALVAAHGGELGYRRSEALGGACFALRLPLDRDQLPVPVTASVPSTFPARLDRIHSGLPGPVFGRFGPSPALSRRQGLPHTRMSTGGDQ